MFNSRRSNRKRKGSQARKPTLKPFELRDNVDLDNFLKLKFEDRQGFLVEPEQLNFVFEGKGAKFVEKTGAIVEYKGGRKGFWTRKDCKGYSPISRDCPIVFYNTVKKSLVICAGYSS
mmetsp:Transcript_10526/g.7863  ORF Transcript_10526/g.7863 Transcript_10526/m.7863 type:complete len:118 (+) Transcript_10526:982-1335(+)